MSALESKITITAIDHVSSVVKNISKSLDGLKQSTKGLGTAWGEVNRAGGDFLRQLRNISLVAIAAGGSMLGLVRHYSQFAEELGLASERTGVSLENLQKLQFAVSLTGVSVDELNTSLKFLNRSIAVGSSNPASQQAAAFNSMGISLKNANGALKTADILLLELSEKFQHSNNAARNTATAMTLFGRQGTTLLPFLKQGPERIRSLTEELTKLGHVWTPEEVALGNEVDDSFDKLKIAVSGLASVVAISLMPIVKPIIEAMNTWIAKNKELIGLKVAESVDRFGKAVKEAWPYVLNIVSAISRAIDSMGGFRTIIAILAGIYVLSLVNSFATLITSLLSLSKAFLLLSASILANPIVLITIGIVALGVAIYQLVKHWDQVKETMKRIWPEVQPYFEAFLNVVTLGMYGLIRRIVSNWGDISSYLKSVWQSIAGNAVSFFSSIYNAVVRFFSPILPFVTTIWENIKNYFTVVINDILGFFGTNLDALEEKLRSIFSGMKKAVTDFLDFLAAPFKKIYSFFEGLIDKVKSIKSIFTGQENEPKNNFGEPTEKKGLFYSVADSFKSLSPIQLGASVPPNANLTSFIPPSQNNRIDIHMEIDYEGRPTKITTTPNPNINFTTSVGRMV